MAEPESPSETWADLLGAGRARLSGRDHAPFEAEELLAHAAGRPRSWFHARRREAADAAAAAAYSGLVARREAGEPLQYLIPRAETEGVVEEARRAAPDATRLADLGTGSGVLAVSLALERPLARVLALDRSPAALALAAANARRHGVAGRVHLLASDWFGALARTARFDLVVANPPYVPLTDQPHLSKTVSEYEPDLALYGGADGLDPLRAILAALAPLLEEGAPFVFEFGYSQARDVSALVEAAPHFRLERVRLDAAGIPRTATAIRT